MYTSFVFQLMLIFSVIALPVLSEILIIFMGLCYVMLRYGYIYDMIL